MSFKIPFWIKSLVRPQQTRREEKTEWELEFNRSKLAGHTKRSSKFYNQQKGTNCAVLSFSHSEIGSNLPIKRLERPILCDRLYEGICIAEPNLSYNKYRYSNACSVCRCSYVILQRYCSTLTKEAWLRIGQMLVFQNCSPRLIRTNELEFGSTNRNSLLYWNIHGLFYCF